MKKFFAVIALAALALAGCGSSGGTTSGAGGIADSPAQLVYAAKTGYATALTAAVAYKRLPTCRVPPAVPCSDPAVVAQLQKADNVTAAALDAAEAAARTPAIGTTATARAVQAAQASLAAMTSLVASLGAK